MNTLLDEAHHQHTTILHHADDLVVCFAGDSGDGMQLAGTQFAMTSAIAGNDVSTLTDYPAEIRAPQGTPNGISGFQVHFGSKEMVSPGDQCDVLIAMNASALKVHLKRLIPHGLIIANIAGFDEKNCRLAGYEENPLENSSLSHYQICAVDMTTLNARAVKAGTYTIAPTSKIIAQAKNFFALGIVYWLFTRPIEPTIEWIATKFAHSPDQKEANTCALTAGWNFGETTELLAVRYSVPSAHQPAGEYRTITGNVATALGLVTAAYKARIELFLGSYPITPASDILHTLASMEGYHIKTFQAEDEIAAIASAIGASYGGALGCTSTSGPGLALKTEALGLAVMAELPLVVVDVQRAGPSTGMPTKIEQSDLFQAVYGRNGEAPLPVLAPATPAECFTIAFEAARIAIQSMTPVLILSDAYIGNSSSAWRVPHPHELPSLEPEFVQEQTSFHPYQRNTTTLARPWVVPGIHGLEHRIGGLEKEHITGNVSYDGANHQLMVRQRAEKIKRIADTLPPAKLEHDAPIRGDVVVIGWGNTYGAIRHAVEELSAEGYAIAHLHIRYIKPFQKNIGSLLHGFKHILVAELNNGQLVSLLRSEFLVHATGLNKIQGTPFTTEEIRKAVTDLLRTDLIKDVS
jgi:2-oxoglutarate ferredoxin oxidoreductase subunit alpha